MKKILSVILVVITVFLLTLPSFASNTQTETEIIQDGSYFVTGEISINDEAGISSFFSRILKLIKQLVSLLTGEKEISKTKFLSYYDKNGTLLWTVYLDCTFTYNGKTSKCTKAVFSADIADKDWKLVSSDVTKDGNFAKADFSVRQYKLGVALKLIEKSITLTCDKNGNIS